MLQIIGRLPPDRFVHVLAARGWEDNAWVDPAGLGPNVRLVADRASGRDRRWALRLAAILREHDVDVLHIRGFSMLLDALASARLARGVAVAFSFHGFEEPGHRFSWLRKRLYRTAVLRCDDRWAVSRAAADAVAAKLGLAAERFGVLTNGADVHRYEPALDAGAVRRRLGLPEDRLLVLSVGNLKAIKGHDALLEAFRQLGEDADRATLIIVGRDYLDGELRRWADRHLAGRDVRFIGEQTDVLPWYQAADLFVLPSRWEGMSNALLEAMSCGLAVVATDVGGNREAVRHERSGFLVPANAPDQLASAMRRLLRDASLRRTFGRTARRSIVADHSIELTIKRYAGRYEALAGFEETVFADEPPVGLTAATGADRAMEKAI
jgi:glycosyltransferase involved in cell wall biosynthesis